MVWRNADSNPGYRAAIWNPDARVDAHVEIIDGAGTVLARAGGDPDRPGIVSGQVNLRGDEHVRFTADLTIADDSLLPHAPGDLLHPLTYNRVRVWWDIALDEAGTAWASVPLGTGFVSVDDITDDGAPVVEADVRVADAASLIKRALMEMSAQVGGLAVDDAVRGILREAAPWATLRLSPSGHRLPADYEAGEPDADPWEVCTELAVVAGMRLYVDRMGDVVLEDDSGAAAVSATFAEGPGCKATSATTTTDLAELVNVVTVTTGAMKDPDGNDLDPITVTVRDEDPSSPTRVDRGYLMRHPVITADEATTAEQLEDIARAKLAELTSPLTTVRIEHFPHPHLDPGDTVEVGVSRLGVAGARRVRSWSLALGPTGWQETTTEGRR